MSQMHPIEPQLARRLSLLDGVLVVVGGVIGSGIFLTAGQVADSLRRPDLLLAVWAAGGVISLLACFAFAELAGMYPQAGGAYIFLREAYGELPAFLYGWMMFAVVQTGAIAALSVGFAQYMAVMFPSLGGHARLKLVSVAGIALLTLVNIFGVKRGAWVVNLATWVKFSAMAGLVLLGTLFGRGDWHHLRLPASGAPHGAGPVAAGFGVALISVLFAYEGWAYVTWIAGEVKDASRNVPRALVLGIVVVAAVYVAMNVAYLFALPLTDVMQSKAVVHDAATAMFSSRAASFFTALVALSCFGAMAAAIMATARIFYAMAQDGVFFAAMARVHPRWRTPAFSLVAQGIWASLLAMVGLYDQLLTYCIFMVTVSYVVTVFALFVLRRKQPEVARPYLCTGYPLLPAIYIAIALAWTVNTVVARPLESLAGLGIVLLGVPGYLYWRRTAKKSPALRLG